MSRTIRTKVYKFEELSSEAQSKAIEDNWDWNVTDEWWQFTYDDAENIGLKIKGFDIDRGSYCKGDFTLSANEVSQNIFNNHGEECETYKTAKSFMDEWQPIFNDYIDENSEGYESGENETKLQDIENDFLTNILEDYRIILTKEYEYLTSKESIKDMLIVNALEFTQDGRRF